MLFVIGTTFDVICNWYVTGYAILVYMYNVVRNRNDVLSKIIYGW